MAASRLLFCQMHGPTFAPVTHKALGVRPVETVLAFGRQLGGIHDAAIIGEVQEDLLAADDACDVPAVTLSGQVAAARSLIQDNLAPVLCIPAAVHINGGLGQLRSFPVELF